MTTPFLYDLDLSMGHNRSRPRDFVRGPVPATRAFLSGHFDPIAQDIFQPDHQAVLECLPANWRKAFTRSSSWWFPSIPGRPDEALKQPATRTLYDARGRFLATINATPYRPDPVRPAPQFDCPYTVRNRTRLQPGQPQYDCLVSEARAFIEGTWGQLNPYWATRAWVELSYAGHSPKRGTCYRYRVKASSDQGTSTFTVGYLWGAGVPASF